MRLHYLALLALLALLLASCGRPLPPTPEPGTSTPTRPGPGVSPLPEPGISPISPLPRPPVGILQAAVTHLAGELGISRDNVAVVSFEPVEWSDTSLGCPLPGMVYAQVITPGYMVLLEAAGQQYEIHTDRTGSSVVLCPSTSR